MKKILIADDDRNLTKLLESFLTSVGYEIKVAHDGATALKMIGEYKPDLVVLDVMMPIMDGYSICKTLVEESQYKPLPKIIVLTSRKEDMDKKISEFLGADEFVNKPVMPGELAGKIRELLGT
jgi:two-component system response regulator CpxR